MPSVHLQKHFVVARFASVEKVIEAVHTRIREQPKTCFSDGIRKLVDGYKTYVELEGRYVDS